MKKYKHVLCATDFSLLNRIAVDRAQQLAKLFSAEFSLIHVVEPAALYDELYQSMHHIGDQLLEAANSLMSTLGKELSVTKEHQYVKIGSVKKELLDAVTLYNVDLLVIGTRGYHNASAQIGSIANAVMQAVKCDVFMINT